MFQLTNPESLQSLPLPLHISSIGRFSSTAYPTIYQSAVSWASSAWPANNRAIYAPVSIPSRFTIARFLVVNGTNATGNVDVGLYHWSGKLLVSTGTVARSGTSVIQYFNITDQSFLAGQYYLALVGSSTTGTYFRGMSNAVWLKISGWLQEDLGSTVLPATMTPVSSTVSTTFAFGFTQSDSL